MKIGDIVYVDCGSVYQEARVIGKGHNKEEYYLEKDDIYLEFAFGSCMYWDKQAVFTKEELKNKPVKPILML